MAQVYILALLRELAVPRPWWWHELVWQLWKLVEAVPLRAPSREVHAVLLEVAASDVQHEQAGYNVIRICGRREEVAEPAGMHEVLAVLHEAVFDELRPAESGDDRGLLERVPDSEHALAPEYPVCERERDHEYQRLHACVYRSNGVGERDTPDVPNLRSRDFDASRKSLQLLNPSPQDLVGISLGGVDDLIAYDGVRLRADFIPVLFHNRSWCGIA